MSTGAALELLALASLILFRVTGEQASGKGSEGALLLQDEYSV